MIDIENDVFSYIASALRGEYPGIYVVGEYIAGPSSFPAVTVVEANNVVRRSMRADRIENAADVTYDVNVYSNKVSGKKTEAKQIADFIDGLMEAKGFTRTLRQQVPNFMDASIFRMTIRYEATVGREKDGSYLIYQR